MDVAPGADNALLHRQRRVADVGNGRKHLYFIVHKCLGIEIALYARNHQTQSRRVERLVHFFGEKGEFGGVGILQICAVVDVAEHIDVGEAFLYLCAVPERYRRLWYSRVVHQ